MKQSTSVRLTFKNGLILILLSIAYPIYAEDDPYSNIQVEKPLQNVQTVEEIVVTAQRRKGMFDELNREYSVVDGKRIFTGPYGEMSYILAIGQELKNHGEMKRIMSRRIKMPPDFPGSSLNQYQYRLAHECGIEKFQLYDGGEFMALGFVQDPKEIIFDVLIGGGPFSAPGIWGPYDQILGKRHGMELIMGDADKDGMGLLKSGYAVGMKADLPNYELMEFGDLYGNAIEQTGKCLSEKINIEAAKRFLSRN